MTKPVSSSGFNQITHLVSTMYQYINDPRSFENPPSVIFSFNEFQDCVIISKVNWNGTCCQGCHLEGARRVIFPTLRFYVGQSDRIWAGAGPSSNSVVLKNEDLLAGRNTSSVLSKPVMTPLLVAIKTPMDCLIFAF